MEEEKGWDGKNGKFFEVFVAGRAALVGSTLLPTAHWTTDTARRVNCTAQRCDRRASFQGFKLPIQIIICADKTSALNKRQTTPCELVQAHSNVRSARRCSDGFE